ncbi:hypothetical protein BGX38DRAFT_1334028 [Terfezia claveryi]|nr:hypothetical protein BGX38DRAFT_1334028 [Terfezia claveryi]
MKRDRIPGNGSDTLLRKDSDLIFYKAKTELQISPEVKFYDFLGDSPRGFQSQQYEQRQRQRKRWRPDPSTKPRNAPLTRRTPELTQIPTPEVPKKKKEGSSIFRGGELPHRQDAKLGMIKEGYGSEDIEIEDEDEGMDRDEFEEREEREWQESKKQREQSTLDAAHTILMKSRKESCSSWDIFEAEEDTNNLLKRCRRAEERRTLEAESARDKDWEKILEELVKLGIEQALRFGGGDGKGIEDEKEGSQGQQGAAGHITGKNRRRHSDVGLKPEQRVESGREGGKDVALNSNHQTEKPMKATDKDMAPGGK